MGIAAVIFDFNGVLVNDESVHFALFQEVLAREGVTITERDYHEHTWATTIAVASRPR